MDECQTCHGYGQPLMCPACLKVGQVQVPVKRKTSKKPFSHLSGKEKADAIRAEEKRKERVKRDELNALWDSLTLELWQRDRRKYLTIMKVIKRKESSLFA